MFEFITSIYQKNPNKGIHEHAKNKEYQHLNKVTITGNFDILLCINHYANKNVPGIFDFYSS
jgi:hypothetical protein